MDKVLSWPGSVVLSSAIVLPAKYAFLREQESTHARNVALIFIAIISLFLATIIALFTEGLRRRATSTGKGAA